MPVFKRFPKIRLLHNVVKDQKRAVDIETFEPFHANVGKKISYKCKIKLHGENNGIVVDAEGVDVQSRSVFVGEKKGGKLVFANTMDEDSKYETNDEYFKSLLEFHKDVESFRVFAEYAGLGVQKSVALSKLKETILCVFSIELDDGQFIIDPKEITKFLTKDGTSKLPNRFYVLPWHVDEKYDIDLLDEKQSKDSIDEINKMVEGIDKNDPWVEKTFGVKGAGEGLVLYAVNFVKQYKGFSCLAETYYESFGFKAKGSAHSVVKTKSKKAVQVNVEVLANINAYVDMFCTEQRMKQGAQEVGGFQRKFTGKFIGWIKNDIKKEGKDELEASGLTFKKVQGPITKKAQKWYGSQYK